MEATVAVDRGTPLKDVGYDVFPPWVTPPRTKRRRNCTYKVKPQREKRRQQGITNQASTKGDKRPRIGGVDQGGVIKQLGGDRWLLEEEHEAGVVTTRYRAALEAAATAEQNTQPPPERTEAEMTLVADDSGMGSLHAHDEKEPTHAIAATPGMRTIAIKSGVLAPVPAGSTSEDYRLKVIPFVLKGDAGVWLSRLPEGSIRTWAEFRMKFLDRFFPASKTSALKMEITEARQEYDEPLGQYWDRFQGLLQACPNHKMEEKEIYSVFYSGLTVDSKNDLNLAAQGDFSKTAFI
ncbi:hypothetical protein SASPL_108607 [Salvia splendens]|uniref:Retrotransposon gag domain-containing protein n=1 Tax=Salvia splendens TaxID=180675 RepID=A0A8X8YH10_SALSN|nr:hypothetical protein SASPL_108607 [Salvia splendens]